MIKNHLFVAAVLGITCMVPSIAETVDLDLGSRVQPLPETNRFSLPNYHVWCGAPVKCSDGKYHLFYSRWPTESGFAPGWALHSEIAYAVSDKPEGPYQHVNVALPPRGKDPRTGLKYWDADVTHNANAFVANGKFYLFYTGQYGDRKNYPAHRNRQRIGVAVADHPQGPWTRFDEPIIDISSDKSSFDSLCVTNPAACLRPDGGVVVIYKAVAYVEGKEMGGRVQFGVATSDQPEGPYEKKQGRVFDAETTNKHWMIAEDPFIWFSEKYGKKYYAIARDVVGTFSGNSGGICLFESRDGLDWIPAKHPKVLDSRFLLADGSLSNQKIERPALLIDNDEPLLLFGATNGYSSKIASSNIQIPLTHPVSSQNKTNLSK
jgi:hypothetical protein